MGLGTRVLEVVGPFLESIASIIPGEYFPYFFTMEMFQRAMILSLIHI